MKSKQALELWQGLPVDTRRMLLSNVWCGECRKAPLQYPPEDELEKDEA